jgi:hypothetical protein
MLIVTSNSSKSVAPKKAAEQQTSCLFKVVLVSTGNGAHLQCRQQGLVHHSLEDQGFAP